MNVRASLIECGAVNKNNMMYSKDVMEALVDSLRDTPVNVYKRDPGIDIEEWLRNGKNLSDLVGIGHLKMDGDAVIFEGTVIDNFPTTGYMVSCCTGTTKEGEDGISVVDEIDPGSFFIDVCDNSAFYDTPNIEVLAEGTFDTITAAATIENYIENAVDKLNKANSDAAWYHKRMEEYRESFFKVCDLVREASDLEELKKAVEEEHNRW